MLPSGLDASLAPLPGRDPARLLERVRHEWLRQGGDLWIFGYASLIWRPELPFCEQRIAQVHGWHRSLRMRSRINRGTPECPGLVFALLPGGTCRGMVFRLPRHEVPRELPRLWAREMPNGVYDPRWLRARTAHGPVHALAFTLSRRSPNHTGPIDDAALLEILRHARGRYGSTLDYVMDTERALRERGLCDAELARVAGLARRHGLAP